MKDKGFGDEFCECEKCLSIHLKGDTSEEEYAERVVKERNDLRAEVELLKTIVGNMSGQQRCAFDGHCCLCEDPKNGSFISAFAREAATEFSQGSFYYCGKCLAEHFATRHTKLDRLEREVSELTGQLADRDAALSEAMDELRLRRDATAITYQPKRSANG